MTVGGTKSAWRTGEKSAPASPASGWRELVVEGEFSEMLPAKVVDRDV